MEHGYVLHRQTRSMSSLASSILPLPPEPSFLKSIVDGSMEPSVRSDLPFELRTPLPPSRPCSDDGLEDIPCEEATSIAGSPLDSRTKQGSSQEPLTIPLAHFGEDQGFNEQEKPLPAMAPDRVTSLSTFRALVASEKFNKDRMRLLRTKMEHLRFRCGLERRLLNTLAHAHRLMTDDFRNLQQHSFVRTNDTCEDLTNKLGTFSRAFKDPNLYNVDEPATGDLFRPTWLSLLPHAQQESLLNFLIRIRTDTGYLADCLCKLSSADLLALTSSYQSNYPIESVLPGYHSNKNHGRFGARSKDSGVPFLEDIQGLLQDNPLFTILHGLFDESFGPESGEYRQKVEVLSTVCAKVMKGGKRGSDELVIAILDSISTPQATGTQAKLEAYLLKVLQDGSSVLEPPLNAYEFSKQPVEIRNANFAIASSNFFERCSGELFALLAEGLSQIVPIGTIRFVQAILGKIDDPVLHTRAKKFIVSKWFFCTFISNLLMYPESRGLMLKHHIGDTARQGLLKTLASRVQKEVLEVVSPSPWNRHSLVNSTTGSAIEKIFSLFETAKLGSPNIQIRNRAARTSSVSAFLTLSPRIVVSLIRALLPPAPPSPISMDLSPIENASAASSVAASSTLTSGSMDFGSAVPSSQAPSICGTSMTSTTMLSEYALVGSDSGQGQAEDETSNATHKAGSSTKVTSGSSNTTLSDACQLIAIALDSQARCLSIDDTSNWAFVQVSENGLDISSTSIDSEQLGMKQAPQDPQPLETHPYRNLYDKLDNAISEVVGDAPEDTNPWAFDETPESENPATLYSLLESAMTNCQSRSDYNAAYFWWQNVQIIDELSQREGSEMAAYQIINYLTQKKTSLINRSDRAIELLGNEVHYFETLAAHQKKQFQAMRDRRMAVRDKMWYTLDVKHSKVYEDALNVTHALRVMADTKRTFKRPFATTKWARQRLRTSNSHDKSQWQALETLVSPEEYGGFSKLNDNQVEVVTRWMTKNSIENFCRGEELIHRFCQEIERCVNKLAGPDMLDSPVLWSSDLFKYEKGLFKTRRTNSYAMQEANATASRRTSSGIDPAVLSTTTPSISSTPLALRNLAVSTPKSINSFWHATKPASHFMEGMPYFKQPQYSPMKNSALTYSTTGDSVSQNSKTPTSHESLLSQPVKEVSEAHKAFANQIKTTVTALLLSDLGYMLWNGGSETDTWINESNPGENIESQSLPHAPPMIAEPLSIASTSALSDALSDSTITINQHDKPDDQNPTQAAQIDDARHSDPSHVNVDRQSNNKAVDTARQSPFPFLNAFKSLLTKFSLTSDPFVKLEVLAELESLVVFSIESSSQSGNLEHEYWASLRNNVPTSSILRSQGLNIPRTKATSLEEVMANCTERRAGTMKFASSRPSSSNSSRRRFDPPDTDTVVNALLQLFRKCDLRPRTLFRDLQLIATFIPSEILDQSAKGKAFWDVGLAALAYKEERCEAVIRRANRITNYHVSANKDTSSFMNAYSSDLVDTSLGDAAQLWVTIAKEGSPVACRELGLFYLTHPELLPRVTLPFSKSKDIFKSVTSSDRTSIETGGLDPFTFAVVFHWMELAANGGDKDARDFLRGNGELSTARS